jgi:hypothetical protein
MAKTLGRRRRSGAPSAWVTNIILVMTTGRPFRVNVAMKGCAVTSAFGRDRRVASVGGFDQGKAPKNIFANEPSLSVQGTGGSCGSSDPDPGGNTIASGIMMPGNFAWKPSFIPPSSPL